MKYKIGAQPNRKPTRHPAMTFGCREHSSLRRNIKKMPGQITIKYNLADTDSPIAVHAKIPRHRVGPRILMIATDADRQSNEIE